MSVFSKIAKHFPLEHIAPDVMMPNRTLEQIAANVHGEPFKFCTPADTLKATGALATQTVFMKFEDYHWVLTQETFNRSKIMRGECEDTPIRMSRYGKTIFVLDGHHRYLDTKYFKKENGILSMLPRKEP